MTQELDTGTGVDAMVEQMGAAIVEGVTQGLAGSELVSSLNQALDAITERIDRLEGGSSDASLKERIAELEREVARLKAGQAADDKAAKPKAPPVVPANMPKSPSIANLPFGLSAERPKRNPPRRRSRTASRPTVIYRTDPRAAAAASKAEAEAEAEAKAMAKAREEAKAKEQVESSPNVEPDPAPATDVPVDSGERDESTEAEAICSEPNCDRPVRCRGLCSLHYQRLRYKERKIEAKQEFSDPVPMPPPPRRRSSAASSRKGRSGGTKGVFALLYEERGRRTLAGLINQMKLDRADLVERLNKQFAGMPGVPLEAEDVLRAIHYHKLGDVLSKREGEIICRHLNKQRGSLAKAAQKLKLDMGGLQTRIDELELRDEVARIRNGFREEVLEMAFPQRLDLALTREKYLKDLGIEDEVDTSLRDEIEDQLARLGQDAEPDEAQAEVKKALSLDAQRFRRMVRRYGLADRLGLAEELEDTGNGEAE